MTRSFRALLCASTLASLTACAAPHPATPPAPPPVPDRPLGDGGVSPFYQPPATVPAEAGRMIRTETIQGLKLPDNADHAERILYTSISGVGKEEPVSVSGQIIFPKGTPPKGGWPVIAWEHGTTGIADVCAPSWRGYFSRDRAFLDHWLSAGFAIVASDYQGLGTPGPHPYLMYKPEAYSVLNALRAALKQYPDKLRNRIVLVGQSQGGGAALGTGWMAPRYAPDLHILGVVATGVVTDFAVSAHPKHPPMPRSNTESPHMAAGFEILTDEGSKQSLHPGQDMDAGMTEKGHDLSRQARQSCLGDLFRYTDSHDITTANMFTAGVSPEDPAYIQAFTIPNAHFSVPVFVGTGLADGEAGISQQYNAVAAMCDAGTHVTWAQYHGLTHNGAVNPSANDSVPFALGLLKGKAPKSTCSTLKPLGHEEEPTPGIKWNN
ncbi:alpha/beta hydrolase [Acetobacter malorum]|uniref:alpha/beta hydrolase n=1 Tax=Acetobacter malorum TaxID=178901 RepID=UPI000778171E|nr:alpha/beta hydrolase [Acetobacter malorum]KXV06301.1 lipase [Acetobacter malorum]